MAFPFPSRLVYRFMSRSELETLLAAREPYLGHPDRIEAAGSRLLAQMNVLTQAKEFGEQLHDFTLTPYGGGRIGTTGQIFVATTSDVERLTTSTDDVVQRIVSHADMIATFHIPKAAAVDAPSDLSQSEGEVVVPNMLSELGAMLIDYRENPYKQ